MPGDLEFREKISEIKTAGQNTIDAVASELGHALHREGGTWRMQGGASRSDNALAIYNEGQTWWDFSVGEGGDVVDFVMKSTGMSFQESCRWLAARAGVTWEEASPEIEAQLAGRRRAADTLTAAFEFMRKQIPQAVADKLKHERGLTDEDLWRYALGWQTEALRGYLDQLGFSGEEIRSTGLYNEDGSPKFPGRVLIPVTQGRKVVSYIGRATEATPAWESTIKYRKPAGNHVSEDGHLFGHDSITGAGTVLVVEGAFDAIACHNCGYAAVAILGSTISEKQATRLHTALKAGVRVVVVPDSDPPGSNGKRAGMEGAEKTARTLWDMGIHNLFVAMLPNAADGGKHDPDSFLRLEGQPKFRQLIEQANDILVHLLHRIDPNKSAFECAAALQPIFEMLVDLDDKYVEARFLEDAAKHLMTKTKALEKQYLTVKKKTEESQKEMLRIAVKINEMTHGELLCLAPPKSARDPISFFRVQPEGHILPVPPETLQDLYNEAAGRPLLPQEHTLTGWFLATSVLEHRGGQVIQTGVLCKNGFIEFGRNPGFNPQRPAQPTQFYVPRKYIAEDDLLPPLEELEVVKSWQAWGIDFLELLEVVGHAVLTDPSGDYYLFFGPGGEGKSTYMKFNSLLLGEWNVHFTSAEEFSGERRLRGIAAIRGRLLVVIDDAPARVLDVMGNFLKEATTADTLTGAALYENPTSFANTAAFAILSNHPSHSKDSSRGGRDRVQVIVWGNRLRATTGGVHGIEKTWGDHVDELDVIFSYAVRLAMDFARSGKWRCSRTPDRNQFIIDSLASTEGKFLWECFEQAEENMVSWDEVKDCYDLWWRDYDHRPTFDQDRFLNAVDVTWGGKATRKQVDGHRFRGVLGIRPIQKHGHLDCPRPSLADVFPMKNTVKSGQENPQICPTSSRIKKEGNNDEYEKDESHEQEGAEDSVGILGHSLSCQELADLVDHSDTNNEYLQVCREAIVRRVDQEGCLHVHRALSCLPEHLQPQLDRLLERMILDGEIVVQDVWISKPAKDGASL